jgi:hypothetical protein
MTSRTALITLAGATMIAIAACSTNTPTAVPSTVTVTAPASSTAQPSPTAAAPSTTRVPCELLTPDLAKEAIGDDAQRQLQLDSAPPQPVGDDACFYKGAAGTVEFTITPMPADPDAPVNHFHVIQPENRIPDLAYEAYWFGAGESVVVVKDGLLLTFDVSDNRSDTSTYEVLRDKDIKLADQIVPRVG